MHECHGSVLVLNVLIVKDDRYDTNVDITRDSDTNTTPKSDSQLTTLTHNNCPIDFVVTPGSFRPSPGLQLRATSLAFAPRRGGECVTHHVGDTEPDDEVLSEGGEI